VQIPVKFHAAVIAINPENQFSAEIQVKTSQGEIIRVWSDTFFDPLTAMQAMTQAFGELQS
jgi:hypothetical protein